MTVLQSRPATILPLFAALAAAIAVPLAEPGWSHTLIKGVSVSMLALAALLLPAPNRDRLWLAGILALGSLGDVLLELPGLFIAGGASFAAGHMLAITFYRRNRVRPLGLPSLALIGWGAVFPSLLLPAGERLLPTLYALLLCTMAASALASRFPRPLLGLGALLFVVSDTLLIMRLGGHMIGPAFLHGLAVWGSYWAAQALIFAGIATSISRR
jgi:uncharacterized membrane protein YhhN